MNEMEAIDEVDQLTHVGMLRGKEDLKMSKAVG
jgi:hypothetical protein